MAKFAQYYSTYINDNLFANLEWAEREEIFREFLETEDGIRFSDKTIPEELPEKTDPAEPVKQKVKIYRHKIYHLVTQPKILVMRIANVKVIPIEKDFKPEQVEHYPSLFVIFDLRDGCRRVAIQKLSSSFSTTDMVAKILQKTLGDAMKKRCNIGITFKAQRYTTDFIKLWKEHEMRTSEIHFRVCEERPADPKHHQQTERIANVPDMEAGVVSFIYQLVEASKKSGYNTAFDVEAANGGVLHVDETSDYMMNMIKYCAFNESPIELKTSDGRSFTCYVDSDFESDDKIVTQEFDASYLEALFDAEMDGEARQKTEEKVVEFVNSQKLVVNDEEKEVKTA